MNANSQRLPGLDFRVVERPLDTLLTALGNKIEREWPARFATILGAREFFLITTRAVEITYRSVRWLCADTPPDPHRKLEYSISVPPLNRTILDSLITVIFISEDLSSRCEWYFKTGWRETRLEFERYRAEYGHLPEWQDWLKKLENYSDTGTAYLGLSASETSNPSGIKRWPNPGAMVNYGLPPAAALPPSRAFLKYLNDWFYIDLSQQSHLGGSGLTKRAGFLIQDYRNHPDMEQSLKKYKYAQVGQTIALVLALATEIDAHFDFGLHERTHYLWAMLLSYIPDAKELYQRRYAELVRD